MKYQRGMALAVILAGSGIFSTQAADISVHGTVIASPCQVDTASVSQSVDFGQARGTDLKEAGAAGEWKPFQVRLLNCPAATTRATATFVGRSATEDATLFANSGTAENVAVQMAQNANRTVIQGNGSTMTVNVDAQRGATYALAGRLYSVNGNTGAGTFSSVVEIDFTYQ